MRRQTGMATVGTGTTQWVSTEGSVADIRHQQNPEAEGVSRNGARV